MARGMPLGLMPGMSYEEKEFVPRWETTSSSTVMGLVEAHDPEGEMFGFPRLRKLIMSQSAGSGKELVDFLLAELTHFTGTDSSRRTTSPWSPWRDPRPEEISRPRNRMR